MLFAIWCRDAPGAQFRRAAALAEHRRYVDRWAASLLLSGPLLAEDDVTRCGQLFVLDVADRTSAEAFLAGDPFTAAEVFGETKLCSFQPVFRDGRRT